MNKKVIFGILILGLVVSLAFPMVMGKNVKVSRKVLEEINQNFTTPMNILIETNTKDYSSVASMVKSLGGTVTHTYDFAPGIAAEIPANAIFELRTHTNVRSISKDEMRYLTDFDLDLQSIDKEIASEAFSLGSEDVLTTTIDPSVMESDDFSPETYANPQTMHAAEVWDSTNDYGQDSLVVIIDTGIWPQHFMLAGSVIGGIDLSPDQGIPALDWDSPLNHYHGTHCAGIVAGHGAIGLPANHILIASIDLHSPGTTYELSPYPGYKWVDLMGMAPAADLYGIKVFPSDGSGVATSYILAGIDHAIWMHEEGGYDVDVISMSLGGGTVFDGRNIEDRLIDYATSIGITVVTSAGNEGPASQTVGRPGTSNTAISVGAAANPINTRVFWDNLYNYLGVGNYLYTTDDVQIYAFSSRGPTSDGRLKPTLSATGMFVLSSTTPDPDTGSILAWASGTSMACPAVSGTVALLNTYSEVSILSATPYDYKQALIAGADPIPYYDEFDQGAGYLNAYQSLMSLVTDPVVGEAHPDLPNGYSHVSVEPKGMEIGNGVGYIDFSHHVGSLQPGHAEHFYFKLHPNVERITLEITNVDLGFDPFGIFNSFEIYIQSALRSTYGYYFDTVNVWEGGATFVIEDMSSVVTGDVSGIYSLDLPLMPGYVKIVIENDFTSFDVVSADISIKVEHGDNSEKGDERYHGSLNTYDWTGYFPVGFGSAGAGFTLSWNRDWVSYPTSDLDLVVVWFDKGGGFHYTLSAATLNSPEMVRIMSPDIDNMFVYVDGYQTNGFNEVWKLDVFYLE